MVKKIDNKILDVAIAREVNAYQFYMTLYKQQTEAIVADLFKSLADEDSF